MGIHVKHPEQTQVLLSVRRLKIGDAIIVNGIPAIVVSKSTLSEYASALCFGNDYLTKLNWESAYVMIDAVVTYEKSKVEPMEG